MTDETFRLTALDVRRYDFGGALRGYDKARVEQFREQAAAELERLVRLNQELEQKARNFHEQLRAFRERDRALNEALISAQQLRQDSKETADREADLIRREAQAEAERVTRAAQEEATRVTREAQDEATRLVRDAQEAARRQSEQLRGEQRRIEEEISSLDRAHRTYLAQLRLLAERQLAELSVSEERTLPAVNRRAVLEAGRDATPLGSAAARLEAVFDADVLPSEPPASAPAAGADAAG